MASGADRIVVQGQQVYEGTSLYVRPSARIAWVTSIDGDQLRMESRCQRTVLTRREFRDGVREGDIVLEVQPRSHRDAQRSPP